MTAEEKVDAWHNGTRRENYKAAGIPKLNTFLEIAKRKGYDEIVKIIEDELARRGTSTPAATSTKAVSTTAPAVKSVTTTIPEPESEAAIAEREHETTSTSAEVVDEPVHFSDELVKDLDPAPATLALSDKEKEVLIGKAIDALGKPAFYVRSYWKTAVGFIGSYTQKWFNGNFNEVKADRASDKAVDLTYDSSKLIVLRKDIDAGYRNVDRYYSIEIPSSTYYIVDRAKIRNNASDYYTYYDSELDWRFSTLTKTNANRKKFKQYLIDTVGMPEVQAEELTAEAFDNNEW
jgi:hypothetical protein